MIFSSLSPAQRWTSSLLALCLLLLTATSCEREAIAPPLPESSDKVTFESLSKANHGRVIHHVTAGSPDACAALGLPQGCDASFSLTAVMFADGSVRGQYNDKLKGSDGLHGTVDCMIIDGNSAIIGGVITNGNEDISYAEGTRFVTMVVDNGTSANDDPDQISFSYGVGEGVCGDFVGAAFPLLDLTAGQVVIR
jgi:hypothetical protein